MKPLIPFDKKYWINSEFFPYFISSVWCYFILNLILYSFLSFNFSRSDENENSLFFSKPRTGKLETNYLFRSIPRQLLCYMSW